MNGHEHNDRCLVDCNRCHQPMGDDLGLVDETGHWLHRECAPQLVRRTEPNLPASVPRAGEVIPRPYDDLALEKVAPEEQRTILDAMKAEPVLGLHDPFDDPEIPDVLRRKHDQP